MSPQSIRAYAPPQRQASVLDHSRANPTPTPAAMLQHSNAERTAAAEEFYESTPWANPNHPSHAQINPASFYQPQLSSLSYATPAAQMRATDAVNGSAGSTVDALSGPPSSVAPGTHSSSHHAAASHHVMDQLNHAANGPNAPAADDTPVPMLKRVGSGAGSAPPMAAKRELYGGVMDLDRPSSTAARALAPPDHAPFDAQRTERPGGLLGQRTGPFAVGVGGDRRFGS